MKKTLLLLSVIFAFSGSHAQTVVRQNLYWPNMHPEQGYVAQDQTGEDWFYDIKMGADGNIIGAGYVTFASFDYEEPNGCGSINVTSRGTECWNNELGAVPTFNIQAPDPPKLSFESGFDNRHHLGTPFATIGKVNPATGSLLFLRTYAHGEFFKVIPTRDGGLIAVGSTRGTQAFLDGGNALLTYNPGISSAPAVFRQGIECPVTGERSHALVVKLDASDNIQWMFIYGMEEYSTGNEQNAYDLQAVANDVVQKSNGNFLIVGKAEDSNSPASGTGEPIFRAFIMELREINGNVVWKQFYGAPGKDTEFNSVTRSGDDIYVGGRQLSTEQLVITSQGTVFATKFESEANPTEQWTFFMPAPVGTRNQFNSHIAVNSTGTVIHVPMGDNCHFRRIDSFQGHCEQARVYRLDASGNFIGSTDFGSIKAFDLKFGITVTSDDGFAVVSTKKTNFDNGPWANKECDVRSDPTIFGMAERTVQAANSDAYVAKCDANGNIEWETTFDSDKTLAVQPEGDPFTDWILPDPAMLDNKSQECVYSIAVGPDGDFFIGGNASPNFDDIYLVKISNSCVLNLTNHRFSKSFDEPNAIVGEFKETAAKYTGKVIVAGNGEFIVKGNDADATFNEHPGEVVLAAAEEIRLLPGFHARAGSEFHAFIDQSVNCTPGPVMARHKSDETDHAPNDAKCSGGSISATNKYGESAFVNAWTLPLSDTLMIEQGDTLIIKGQVYGCGLTKFKWYKNDTLVSSGWATSNPEMYTTTFEGSYRGYITNTDGNSFFGTIVVLYGNSTGIRERNHAASVVIFPNPSTAIFEVKVTSHGSNPTFMQVANTLGQVVRSLPMDMDEQAQSIRIDLSDQPEGIYFLTVLSDNNPVAVKKLLLIR